jgi:hypothetical protein
MNSLTIGAGGEVGAGTRAIQYRSSRYSHVLGDTFMLLADFVDSIRFRISGDSVFGGKRIPCRKKLRKKAENTAALAAPVGEA